MKIELNHLDDVAEFLSMLDPQFYHRVRTHFDRGAQSTPEVATDEREKTLIRQMATDGLISEIFAATKLAELGDAPADGLPTDIVKPDAPQPVEDTGPSPPVVAALAPEVDATGRKWNERIDSSNKGLNADGTWRARRNHGLSAEEVAAIKAEMMVAAEPTAEPQEAEPEVTTETHPLPVREPEAPAPEVETPVREAAAPLDLDEVLIKGAELAQDASDSHMDVLSASREFISSFDLDVYNAVKAATVEGKALQTLTPGERRLLIGTLNAYTQANGNGAPDAS